MASALSLRATPHMLLPEPKTMTLSSGHIMLGSVPAITVSDKCLVPLGEIPANDLVTLYRATRPTVAVGVPKAGGIILKLVKGNSKYDSLDAYTLHIDKAAKKSVIP